MLVRSTVRYISVFALWNACMMYYLSYMYTCSLVASVMYIFYIIAFFIELYIQFLFCFDCRSYIVHSFFYFTLL